MKESLDELTQSAICPWHTFADVTEKNNLCIISSICSCYCRQLTSFHHRWFLFCVNMGSRSLASQLTCRSESPCISCDIVGEDDGSHGRLPCTTLPHQ